MEINGKVHCFFEQSGTFKNEFLKLGIVAEDYDLQNNYAQTENKIDLFREIKKAYNEEKSLFDTITEKDLIIAFFPCIYFEALQMTAYQLTSKNYQNLTYCERINEALERLQKRTYYHSILYKLLYVVMKKRLRLILENPATQPNYLVGMQNFPNPTFVDRNRMIRGDYFKKPTAYWFFNCVPSYGESFQEPKIKKKIGDCKKGKEAGICSEERSLISSDYARNFICDFILGKKQENGQLVLF